MSDIMLKTEDGRLRVECPYSDEYVKSARDLGGKWNGAVWIFDPRDEARVRELLTRVYGHDGTAHATCTVHVNVHNFPGTDYRKIVFAGRTVAHRMYRDSRVRLTGAVVIAGGFPASGGSMKNPALCPKSDTVLEIRDVPVGHADCTATGVTIISPVAVEREALWAERARLMDLVAKIDRQLES